MHVMNITENLLGRLKYLLTVGMTLLALHLSFSADLPADFKVDVIGGAHRLAGAGNVIQLAVTLVEEPLPRRLRTKELEGEGVVASGDGTDDTSGND